MTKMFTLTSVRVARDGKLIDVPAEVVFDFEKSEIDYLESVGSVRKPASEEKDATSEGTVAGFVLPATTTTTVTTEPPKTVRAGQQKTSAAPGPDEI